MTTPLHSTAEAWHDAGACVLPAATDSSKRPAVSWRRYQSERPDRDDLAAMLDGVDGIGIVCGAVSGGVELLELEGRAVAEGYGPRLGAALSDHGYGDLWQTITTGYVESTPSGGIHYLYRVDAEDSDARGNTKLARRPATDDELAANPGEKVKVLIETRGEGGWVVIAPSGGRTHPTGKSWAVLVGGPTTIPTITAEQRDALHAIATTLDTTPVRDEPAELSGAASALTTTTPTTSAGGVRPGDDYNAKATWDDILTPHGWTRAGRLGPGYGWTRPGKSTRDGISATTGQAADGVDRLYVFSSSTDFDVERPYSKFAAYCVLNHRGDMAAAARALAKQGYGEQKPRRLTVVNAPPPAAPTALPADSSDGSTARVVQLAPRLTVAASDDGNAQALIDRYGDVIRYCVDRGRWYAWDTNRWELQPSKGGRVREYAKNVARDLPANDRSEAAWQQRSLSAVGITAALTSAESDVRVTAALDDFDTDPWALNTPGGVVDLRTGTLAPSAPAGMHTRITAATPDPDADQAAWLDFLATTFNHDNELVSYMQRLIGYSATGYIGPHVLPFAYGHGGNGKGVTLESVSSVLGDYATTAPNGFLMAQNYSQHETEIARLSGARMVLCSEVNEHDRFDESKIKQLTGGDTLTARFMRQDHFTFKPTHHLWLMGNHKPAVTSGGDSFWRRCRLIPFVHTVPKDRMIDGLQEQLTNDHGPAILAWIVAGAVDFHRNGLREPASVAEATAAYAHDQDTVARFVEEECHRAPGSTIVQVRSSEINTAYLRWCDDNGESPVSAKRFIAELVNRFEVGRGRSNGRKMLTGICLLALDDDGGEVTR